MRIRIRPSVRVLTAVEAPAAMDRPDYHAGSIVNLMRSVAGGLGGPSLLGRDDYQELAALPSKSVAGHRAVVLAVIDGLGYNFLNARPDSFLARHCKVRMTSVFPTTTATAITSYLTGLAPQQHGLTGWFTYLRELGGVAAVLPFRPRGGGAEYTKAGLDPRVVLDWPPLFDQLAADSTIVTANYIRDSVFSTVTAGRAPRCGYDDLAGLVARSVEFALSEGGTSDRTRFIYAYWPKLDALAHEHGASSKVVADHFTAVDAAIAELAARLRGSDTLLVVSADHGLVDTDAQHIVHVADHPSLDKSLVLPLCGEPRAAYCYVRPSRARAFRDYVEAELAETCLLKPSEELIEQGYFGHGTPHPRLRERVGDYVLLMRDNWVIKDQLATEAPFAQIGVHGGLSADELYVPLIIPPTN